MCPTNPQSEPLAEDGVEIAIDAAESLGQALAASPVFKRFEAAYERFQADEAGRRKLDEFESREKELRQAAMWGGADPREFEKMEREWQTISAMPILHDYFEAQERLAALFREVSSRISNDIGIDYGAACSPAGGCC